MPIDPRMVKWDDESAPKTIDPRMVKWEGVDSAPLSKLDKIGRGMRDPIDAGAQMLENAVRSAAPGVVDAINSANNWLADKTGMVGRLPSGGVDQQVRQMEADYQARRAAQGESGIDGYALLTDMADKIWNGQGVTEMNIDELEQENMLLRARNERLEKELAAQAVPEVTYDEALNEAGWAMFKALPPQSLDGRGFNSIKPALKVAIEKWLSLTAAPPAPEVQQAGQDSIIQRAITALQNQYETDTWARAEALQILMEAPQPAAPAAEQDADSFAILVAEAIAEAEKAMRKFPQPNYVLLKVAEEAGEVVKAGVHFAEGRDTAEHVRDEMRQNIAMLYRLWKEGDQRNGVPAIDAAMQAAGKGE